MSVAVALLLIIAGCDTVGEGAEGNASLSVLMTDAPFPFELAESAEVTISGISIQNDAEGRVDLSDDVVTLNLLDLAGGVTAELADDVEIPAGVYNKILLQVTDASVTLEDGSTFDVNVPSDRIQILLGNLELDEGEDATVVLDFDVGQSFVVLGNPSTPAGINGFNFKPVVRTLGFFSRGGDDDEGAELQGAIEIVGNGFIEVGGTRYLITDETEIDGGTAASLREGMVVEIEFVQNADGSFVATEIEIEDDQDREVRELSGVVTGIETVEGRTFIVVGDTRFEIVPGETEFDGVAGVDGLVVDQTVVEVDFVANAEGDGWIAIGIEVED